MKIGMLLQLGIRPVLCVVCFILTKERWLGLVSPLCTQAALLHSRGKQKVGGPNFKHGFLCLGSFGQSRQYFFFNSLIVSYFWALFLSSPFVCAACTRKALLKTAFSMTQMTPLCNYSMLCSVPTKTLEMSAHCLKEQRSREISGAQLN